MNNDTQNDCYVYYYIRDKDSATAKAGTPYYVGKGRKSRISGAHLINIPSDPSLRVKIAEHLTDQQALKIESLHIKLWGRKDLGTGLLHNKTNGDAGSKGLSDESRYKIGSGNRGKKRSASHCKKISESNKGKIITVEQRLKIQKAMLVIANTPEKKQAQAERNRNRVWTRESKEKVSARHKGKEVSQTTRNKLSAGHKGVKKGPTSTTTKTKLAATQLGNKIYNNGIVNKRFKTNPGIPWQLGMLPRDSI
jgi:hypothetical protein